MPPRRAGLLWRGLHGLWRGFAGVLVAGLFVLAGLALGGGGLGAPQWLIERAERAVNERLAGGRLQLGRLQLQVGRDFVPLIVLGNVAVFDGGGAEVARLNRLEARLSPAALLGGELLPGAVHLSGAQLTLRRRADGRFDLSFGRGAVASGTLPGVLDRLDEAFEAPALKGLGRLRADDLTLTLEDARSGRLWQITDGRLQLQRDPSGLDISIDFDVFDGTEELAEVTIGLRTDRAGSGAAIGTTFRNAAATDIALQAPALSFLGVLDARISGALRAEFTARGELASLAGTLQLGAGALQPTPDVEAVRFSDAKAYFEFDPQAQRLEFSEIRLNAEAGALTGRGHALLRDFRDGWPSVLLGQFALSDIRIRPRRFYDAPLHFGEGAADIRIRLDPFSVDVGQFMLRQGAERLLARGRVAAGPTGWELAADLELNRIDHARLLQLWPVSIVPKTRDWLLRNIRTALLSDVRGAIRLAPGSAPRMAASWKFSGTSLRYIRSQPEIEDASGFASISGRSFTLTVERGHVTAPMGGRIDMSGTVFRIPDVTRKPADALLLLRGAAGTTAVLSLLDAPPFRILRNSGLRPDIARGRAVFSAEVAFALKPRLQLGDVRFSAEGRLLDLRSERLVPGHVLRSGELALRADNAAVEIAGPVLLGEVAADILWRQPLGPGSAGASSVSGQVVLDRAFLREFSLGLPEDSVSGRGSGRFRIDLARGRAPVFTLHSDLNRLALSIPQLGWAKPRNVIGRLDVRGRLGRVAEITLLELETAGLSATGGQVSLDGDGRLARAEFARVRVGEWLDAPVILRGREAGQVPLIETAGGTLDIRRTAFMRGGGSSGRDAGGGPMTLFFDRVIISEGMSLTGFSGRMNAAGGLSGNFTARMNGAAPLAGSLQPEGGGSRISITSDDAGGVLRAAGIVDYASGGAMTLLLRPRGGAGLYAGDLRIRDTRVRNAPGLTELLAALSVVGLLEQLGGEGITFDEVEARLLLSPEEVVLQEGRAVGPALGITLEGVYDLRRGVMDMRGVISPVFFLNRVGELVSRRGEGLFGFSFTLAGSRDALRVGVNPLSILTPGGVRDIFRGPPPGAGAGDGG